MHLETPRARLVPLGVADVEAVHALWTEPDVRRFLWDGEIITRARALEVLEAMAAHFRDRRFGLWGVCVREAASPPAVPPRPAVQGGLERRLAGFAGCRPWATGEPELLYGLHPAWWGQGLATEACEAVLAHVFDTLGHRLVFAAADPPNVASTRVMERLGMIFDRRTEMHGLDTVVYRLSRERWRRLRSMAGRP